MERSEIDAKLKKMLIEHLGVSPGDVQPGTRLVPALGGDGKVDQAVPNLGADSLDVVELVMAAEEEFFIEIPDDEAEPLNDATVESLGDFIAGKLALT
jgi:acyl carrier protein